MAPLLVVALIIVAMVILTDVMTKAQRRFHDDKMREIERLQQLAEKQRKAMMARVESIGTLNKYAEMTTTPQPYLGSGRDVVLEALNDRAKQAEKKIMRQRPRQLRARYAEQGRKIEVATSQADWEESQRIAGEQQRELQRSYDERKQEWQRITKMIREEGAVHPLTDPRSAPPPPPRSAPATTTPPPLDADAERRRIAAMALTDWEAEWREQTGEEYPDRQCIATSKSTGVRCRRMALNGELYCGSHLR